jgi:hypothetical protein
MYMETITTVIIISTIYVDSIANSIRYFINKFNNTIDVKIKHRLTEKECEKSDNTVMYIILFSNETHSKMPKRYIHYQLEQLKSTFFNDKRLQQLKNAEQIWEFSIVNSIKYSNLIETNKINFMPVPFTQLYEDKIYNFEDCEYDIFFFGSLNERRYNILKALNTKYKLFFKSNIFEKERDEYIKKSKIILNLHYYDFASLETPRINEILQYNKLILSENTKNTNIFINDIYNSLIINFDEIKPDLSNITDLFSKLDFYLIKENYNKWISGLAENKIKLSKFSEFYLNKNFINMNIIVNNTYKIDYDVNNKNIYMIHSNDNIININTFNSIKNKPNNLILYPGFLDSNFHINYNKSLRNIIWNSYISKLKYITFCTCKTQFTENLYSIFDRLLEIIEHIDTSSINIIMLTTNTEHCKDNNSRVISFNNKYITLYETNKLYHNNIYIIFNNVYNKILDSSIDGSIDNINGMATTITTNIFSILI